MISYKVVGVLVLSFLACSISWAEDYSAQAKITVPIGKNGEVATVSRVLDGDTLKLSNGQTLKLAGINAPELHDVTKLPEEAKRFGMEIWAYRTIGGDAHKAAQHMIETGGNQIRLEPDPKAFDEAGNLLGYVYIFLDQLEKGAVSDNEIYFKNGTAYAVFLNAYLVKLGLAEVVGDGKYRDLLLKLEQEAKENKSGLWT